MSSVASAGSFSGALNAFIASQGIGSTMVGVTSDAIVFSDRSDGPIYRRPEYAPPIPFVTLPELVPSKPVSTERLAHHENVLSEFGKVNYGYLATKKLIDSIYNGNTRGIIDNYKLCFFYFNKEIAGYVQLLNPKSQGQNITALGLSWAIYFNRADFDLYLGNSQQIFYAEIITQISEQLYLQAYQDGIITPGVYYPEGLIYACRGSLAIQYRNILRRIEYRKHPLLFKELALRGIFNSAFLTFSPGEPPPILRYYVDLENEITSEPKQRAENLLRHCRTLVSTGNGPESAVALMSEVEKHYNEAGVGFDRNDMEALKKLARGYDDELAESRAKRAEVESWHRMHGRERPGTGWSTFGGNYEDLG